MAKRRHSVRRHKRDKSRSKPRTSSKKGGDFTPDELGQIKPYVPFFNAKGKQTIENAKFLDPTKISNIKKNTGQVFPGIFDKSNPNDDEKVFAQEPGYFSKDSVDKRKRTAATEDYNKLMNQYETDNPKSTSKQMCNEETGIGCNIMGGLRRRKTSRRKTSRRKTFRRKPSRRKNSKRKSRRSK